MMMANYMFVDILLAASRMIKESGGAPEQVIPQALRYQEVGVKMMKLEEVLPISRQMLEQAISFRDRQGSNRYGTVIRKAKAFIAEHYGDSNVTLHDVADHVALSNNHFCTVFSQEMGVTFTEYLTGVRMSKAKEMLTSTAMRTSDVAYAVGYNDPHYFSYLFKKHTGLSPRDFRRRKGEKPMTPMDRNSFILGMVAAFCECVAGGAKTLALSPPLTHQDYAQVGQEAMTMAQRHGLVAYHEENLDLPQPEPLPTGWGQPGSGKAGGLPGPAPPGLSPAGT